jgi:hypothetical protein
MDEKTIYTNININSTVRLIGYILLFVAFYLFLLRIDMYLKTQSVVDCAKTSQYQQTLKDGVKVNYPIANVYNDCLKKVGVK